MTERKTQSIAQLEYKIDRINTILDNIERPGWIETWPPNRTHPATGLSLQADGVSRYTTLINVIAPIRSNRIPVINDGAFAPTS